MARWTGDFESKTVLVTGAASGIGKATAEAFARLGADLVLCDIDEEELATVAEELPGTGQRLVERVDVADLEQMQAFAARVHERFGAVDVLVNNAGVAISGGFLDTSLEDWRWITGINLWGVIYGCKLFIPAMVERGRGGHVVNVSSSAGYVCTRMLAAYGTTKFAVFGLSEALRDELQPHGIGVSTICPGIVDTAIVRTMRRRGPSADPSVHERILSMYRKRRFGPEKVAEKIVEAVRDDRGVVPVTAEAWVMWGLKRMFPESTPWILRHAFGRLFGVEA